MRCRKNEPEQGQGNVRRCVPLLIVDVWTLHEIPQVVESGPCKAHERETVKDSHDHPSPQSHRPVQVRWARATLRQVESCRGPVSLL